jgi:hypothetical protein
MFGFIQFGRLRWDKALTFLKRHRSSEWRYEIGKGEVGNPASTRHLAMINEGSSKI